MTLKYDSTQATEQIQNPNAKPKGPTQSERVQTRLDTTTTQQMFDQLGGFAGNQVFDLLERSVQPGQIQTLAEAFKDEQTGGVTIYGTQLPMLDGFNEVALDSSILGHSYKKYQQARKAMAQALEHMNTLENKVQSDIVKRTNQIIRKQKDGKSLVANFQRHLRVSDLELFSPGKTDNHIQFTSSGTFVTLGLTLPVQRFDVSAELDLLGDKFTELDAQRLLQKEITKHVAAMSNHLPTLSMASGLNADPNAVDAETDKPLGVSITRRLTVRAQLWHGSSEISPRQFSVVQTGDGKYNSKKEEVLKFQPMIQSDNTFDGAAPGVVVIRVNLAYVFKVKRNELDDVINGLGMLIGTELPLYTGAEAGVDLEQHYASIGLGLPETEEVEADNEVEITYTTEPVVEPVQETQPEIIPVDNSLTMTDAEIISAVETTETTQEPQPETPAASTPVPTPQDDELVLFSF